MKSCLRVKYSAVKWNNRQGSCGETFFSESLIKPYEGAKIDDLIGIAERHMKQIQIDNEYVGAVSILSITLMEMHEAPSPNTGGQSESQPKES